MLRCLGYTVGEVTFGGSAHNTKVIMLNGGKRSKIANAQWNPASRRRRTVTLANGITKYRLTMPEMKLEKKLENTSPSTTPRTEKNKNAASVAHQNSLREERP